MENQPPKTATPVFLNVLCILTFSGTLVDLLLSAIGAGLSGGFNGHFLYSWMGAYLAGSLVCSGAAVFMLLRRRIGFYIYVPAQLLCISSLAYNWITNQLGTVVASAATSQFILRALVYVAFIVMYTLNLKHLKR